MIQRRITFAILILAAYIAYNAFGFAQLNVAPPTKSQMYNWDQGVISFYEILFYASILLTLVVGISLGFLGKFFWWATRPYLRIVYSSIVILIIVEAATFWTDWLVINNMLNGVDPKYFQFISKVPFTATGLFNGLINAGIPALSSTQSYTMMGILVIAAIIGSGIALFLTRYFLAPKLGIKAQLN